jgi:hypothetical protein
VRNLSINRRNKIEETLRGKDDLESENHIGDAFREPKYVFAVASNYCTRVYTYLEDSSMLMLQSMDSKWSPRDVVGLLLRASQRLLGF